MNSREHIVFGAATSVALAFAVQNPESAIFAHPYIIVGASVLGSILSDVDKEDTKAGSFLLPISMLFEKTVGHRTVTHDLLIMLPLFIVSLFCGNPIFFGIMFGILSHLYLDGLTTRGIPVGSLIWKEKGYFKEKVPKYYIHTTLPFLTVRSGSGASVLVTYMLSAAIVFATNYFIPLW